MSKTIHTERMEKPTGIIQKIIGDMFYKKYVEGKVK